MLKSLTLDSKPAGTKPAVSEKVAAVSKPSVAPPSRPKGPQPEPIENQINTSITQTLKALDVAKMADKTEDEEEEKEEKKGGLFSRFRKSS